MLCHLKCLSNTCIYKGEQEDYELVTKPSTHIDANFFEEITEDFPNISLKSTSFNASKQKFFIPMGANRKYSEPYNMKCILTMASSRDSKSIQESAVQLLRKPLSENLKRLTIERTRKLLKDIIFEEIGACS